MNGSRHGVMFTHSVCEIKALGPLPFEPRDSWSGTVLYFACFYKALQITALGI